MKRFVRHIQITRKYTHTYKRNSGNSSLFTLNSFKFKLSKELKKFRKITLLNLHGFETSYLRNGKN